MEAKKEFLESCPQHPQEISENYCIECNEFCCKFCLELHFGHKIAFKANIFSMIGNDFQIDYEKTTEIMKNFQGQIEIFLQQLGKAKEQKENSMLNVKKGFICDGNQQLLESLKTNKKVQKMINNEKLNQKENFRKTLDYLNQYGENSLIAIMNLYKPKAKEGIKHLLILTQKKWGGNLYKILQKYSEKYLLHFGLSTIDVDQGQSSLNFSVSEYSCILWDLHDYDLDPHIINLVKDPLLEYLKNGGKMLFTHDTLLHPSGNDLLVYPGLERNSSAQASWGDKIIINNINHPLMTSFFNIPEEFKKIEPISVGLSHTSNLAPKLSQQLLSFGNTGNKDNTYLVVNEYEKSKCVFTEIGHVGDAPTEFEQKMIINSIIWLITE